MPTDLYYFYECDLDKTNIGGFLNSLPDHLQSKFKKSNRANIVRGNVLQGYRGPDNMRNGGSGDSATLNPSNGLQEIKFWWGARKDLNFIPVVGTIVFFANRVVQNSDGQLEWRSLYFDSKTGECLSHDKDEASEELNRTGDRLFSDGRYADAAEYFENAYQSCSRHYRNEERFRNNKRRAESEIEAINLNGQGDQRFAQGDYRGASEKYQEAYDKSNVQTRYGLYRTNKEKARAELEAISLNGQGDQRFAQGDYRGAFEKYQEAYNKSNVQTRYSLYRTNKEKASAELEAINLNGQGDQRFAQGDYRGAITKYQEAYDKSNVQARYSLYSNNKEKASAELEAINLNGQGDQQFAQGDYHGAFEKYQEAYDLSRVESKRQIYHTNLEKARAEMEAEEANSRGDVLFQRGEYEKAFEKYRDAANLSAVATNLQNYLANRDKSQDEMVASNLKSSGDSFFERGEYSEAWRAYQRAIDASRVNKALYSTAKDRAKRETEAKMLNCQGNEFFEQGNYNEARTKFNEAHETSQTARDRSAYLLRKTQAQAIVDTLSSLENSWSEAWKAENDGRDQEAAQLFQRVQDDSGEAARAFSGVSKFRLYAALATLKIDGNDSFNQGLESQQKGVQLLREAQNYETAHSNLEEARSCFTNAIDKFDEGSQNDERFASSIELVRELIKEVIRSIDLANREMQSTGMGNLRLDFSVANSSVTNVNNGDSKDYHANI